MRLEGSVRLFLWTHIHLGGRFGTVKDSLTVEVFLIRKTAKACRSFISNCCSGFNAKLLLVRL